MKKTERIYVHDTWLGVGGNTPWSIDGIIESIDVIDHDPSKHMGIADKALIRIEFNTGYRLDIITNDYMVLTKEESS